MNLLLLPVFLHPGFSPSTHKQTSATPGFSSEKQFKCSETENQTVETWNSVENNVLSSEVATAGDFFFLFTVELGTMLGFGEMS